MVKGLKIFQEYFSEFSDQFVLIGGTACDLLMEDAGLTFRATKDLDIVICVEALDSSFVKLFWEFVHIGGYEIKEKTNGSRCFYRFTRPADTSFPAMLELFSRKPDVLQIREDATIIPIPVGEDIVSLSAILLDDDYYTFLHEEKIIVSGFPVVSVSCLIPLKAHAWLDLSIRKANGEQIDSHVVNKHKNDVFRLFQILDPTIPFAIPDGVKADMREFLKRMVDEETNMAQLGITLLTKSQVIQALSQIYCG